METRANALVPAVPFAVLAVAILSDAVLHSLGLYSGAYTGVLPILLAGLLLGLLPILTGLAAGRRVLALHPAGLLLFCALLVAWLTDGHAPELFIKMPDKDNLRSLLADTQQPLALLAALSLGLSFSVVNQHKPFLWRREALWLLAFAAAAAMACVLRALLASIQPIYLSLAAFLVRLCALAVAGIAVAMLLPSPALRRPVAMALLVVGAVLSALLLFYGIRYGVNLLQILRTHTGGVALAGVPGTLYRWCVLLFTGDTIPARWVHWHASAGLLCGLSPLLLVWPLRSLLRRGPAASVAKPI